MENGGADVRESQRQGEEGGGGEASVGDGSGGEINTLVRKASVTTGDSVASGCGRGAEREMRFGLRFFFEPGGE